MGKEPLVSQSASQALVLQSCSCVSVKEWQNQSALTVMCHCRLGGFAVSLFKTKGDLLGWAGVWHWYHVLPDVWNWGSSDC